MTGAAVQSRRYAEGMETRRIVLGDTHVDNAESNKTDFDKPFQELITEAAWGHVWSRPGWTKRERSIVTIALLAALGQDEELIMHIRATANTGATKDDICEALLHVAIYAGCAGGKSRDQAGQAGLQRTGSRKGSVTGGSNVQQETGNRCIFSSATGCGIRRPIRRITRQASCVHRNGRLLSFDNTLSEITGPVFGHSILGELDDDLIHNFAKPGESAIGQRIIVHGRVIDERGKGVAGALLEFWQANAGGRYRHKREGYVAALDPNFGGCGRTITDEDGYYRFRTVKPGAYPWPNGVNDWRPAHIHFSVFGHGFAQRLITQMYFEGDPMIWNCPIVRSIPDKAAIEQLIAALDMNNTIPMDARAYKFDIVLRGRRSTLFENRMEGN